MKVNHQFPKNVLCHEHIFSTKLDVAINVSKVEILFSASEDGHSRRKADTLCICRHVQ